MNFFRYSLGIQMVIATFLGVFCGIFLGDLCSVFSPWCTAYIMILKVTTIPYLICAIIHGVGRLASGTAKEILQKGIFFIGGAWAINIAMIYFTVFLFPQTDGVPYASYNPTPSAPINFAAILIPENIFSALSNNIVPAVVVFGILLGIALMHIKDKKPFMDILDTLVNALTCITGWISRITPIGTFIIIAYQVGTIQLSVFKQVGTYLILYILATLLIVFWVFPRVLSMFSIIPARRWLKTLSPVLLLAYTTNVVIVTLPYIIELIKNEIKQYYHKEDKIGDQIQGIVSIIFNLPLGSLFIAVYVFFVSLFYHIPLSIPSQFQLFFTTFLTSLGSMGLGSWINSLNFLLGTLNLPLDAIDLYLTTLPFTAGFQSMVSVMEVSSLALLITLACHNLITISWKKIARNLTLIVVPLTLLATALTRLDPLPPIANPAKSITDLSFKAPVEVTVFEEGDTLPACREGSVYERIMQTRILRVGYNAGQIPFTFKTTTGDLAGYDIAFAYELALDLGCKLELIPMDYTCLAQDLNAGLYDIAMSGVSITEPRLIDLAFSDAYLDSKIVLVMKKKLRKRMKFLPALIENSSQMIAVLKGSSYEMLAHKIFPAERIVHLNNYNEYATLYPNAVLIRGEPQAISWSLHHPSFSVVTSTPKLNLESLAYPIKANEERFLMFINQWLILKKNENFTKKQYELWVLGKTKNAQAPEARWSIIRDILHWVE
jgi:proton glutamate symport protein